MTTNHAIINRANAQHSTGPKTAAGKQVSSQNSLKHGLTAQSPVLPTEDLNDYQRHVASFFSEYNPQGATETNLVQSIADASWRLNRVADIEAGLIHDAARYIESLAKALSNLSMHSTRLARQFERAVAQLRELQKTREVEEKKEQPIESGFVLKPRVSARGQVRPELFTPPNQRGVILGHATSTPCATSPF